MDADLKKIKAHEYYLKSKQRKYELRKQKIASLNDLERVIYEEKIREQNAKAYQKNRDKILEYKKRHREKYREVYKEKSKERRKALNEKPYYHLKRFGITKDDYLNMLNKQGGVCAICGCYEKGKRLAVDHCHKTNKIRGLLCSACNTSLGKFNDSIELLSKAIKYLEKHNG